MNLCAQKAFQLAKITVAIMVWSVARLFTLYFVFLGYVHFYVPYAQEKAVMRRIEMLNQEASNPNSFAYQLHDGDLIFHTSRSAQSQAIQLATHSPYSHCGILYQQDGRWQVFEAVQPVKLTPLADWLARGKGGHFVTKRLRDAATTLTPAALQRLEAAGRPMFGHGYDLYFG